MINKYFKKINSKLFQKVFRRIFNFVVTPRRVSSSKSVAKFTPNLRQTDFVTNLPLKINYKLIKKYFKKIDSKIFQKKCGGFLIISQLCGGFLFLILSQNLSQLLTYGLILPQIYILKLIRNWLKNISKKSILNYFKKFCDGFSILSRLCGEFLFLIPLQNLPQTCDKLILSWICL